MYTALTAMVVANKRRGTPVISGILGLLIGSYLDAS